MADRMPPHPWGDKMDLGEKLKAQLKANINLVGLGDGIIDIVEEALNEVVASSENSFDDVAFNALWPLLEQKLKELNKKHVGGLLA